MLKMNEKYDKASGIEGAIKKCRYKYNGGMFDVNKDTFRLPK